MNGIGKVSEYQNELGQVVGFPVPDFQSCPWPSAEPMQGHYCRLERLNIEAHGQDLYQAFSTDTEHRNWTYLPYGPFTDYTEFEDWLQNATQGEDPFFHSVIDLSTNKAVGVASYLRITPEHGVIETGHIHYSPLMQRTPLATETMYLMMKRVFEELGYRRYEWKCNALNDASRRAAQRFGFQFEGVFRQMNVFKGRNRDTAWFSILDSEWPEIKVGFERWLESDNFDEEGRQIECLVTRSEQA